MCRIGCILLRFQCGFYARLAHWTWILRRFPWCILSIFQISSTRINQSYVMTSGFRHIQFFSRHCYCGVTHYIKLPFELLQLDARGMTQVGFYRNIHLPSFRLERYWFTLSDRCASNFDGEAESLSWPAMPEVIKHEQSILGSTESTLPVKNLTMGMRWACVVIFQAISSVLMPCYNSSVIYDDLIDLRAWTCGRSLDNSLDLKNINVALG